MHPFVEVDRDSFVCTVVALVCSFAVVGFIDRFRERSAHALVHIFALNDWGSAVMLSRGAARSYLWFRWSVCEMIRDCREKCAATIIFISS